MPEVAYVDGSFVPLPEARVSIEDRGFQFADGVYEVVAAYGGKPYALEPHLQRLERSLAELRLSLDVRAHGLESIIMEGIRRSGFADALIYLQITRGTAPRHHEFPRPAASPTIVMTVKALKRLSPETYAHGVAVISRPDQRWKRCDIKSVSLLPNILAKEDAVAAGAFEALLVDDAGRVTEGSSTSSFCVRDGVLWTTPAGNHILPSITRAVLIQLAADLSIPVRQEYCLLEEYLQAEEVLLAGTTTEALAVVQLDGQQIGTGTPGPVTRALRQAFLETVDG